MEMLRLCPTRACLSFVLPGHQHCPTCERALQMRPPVRVVAVREKPREAGQPLRASA
jgi:hypothetical protein